MMERNWDKMHLHLLCINMLTNLKFGWDLEAKSEIKVFSDALKWRYNESTYI